MVSIGMNIPHFTSKHKQKRRRRGSGKGERGCAANIACRTGRAFLNGRLTSRLYAGRQHEPKCSYRGIYTKRSTRLAGARKLHA